MIKTNKISDKAKLKNVKREINLLKPLCDKYSIDTKFYNELLCINTKLWNIEDKIREKEKQLSFDDEFIELARSVYKNNDQRSRIKYNINQTYKSFIIEIKDY